MAVKYLDKEYLTPSEFAKLVGPSAETLRYYHREGILSAATVDENNYRLYHVTQTALAKMISVLVELQVPHERIKELAKERKPEDMMKLFCSHEDELINRINALQEAYKAIKLYSELLAEGMCATENELYTREVPEKRLILGDLNDFSDYDGYFEEYLRFCSSETDPPLNPLFPVGGYFETMDDFLNEPSQPTRFFSADPNGQYIKTKGLYLIGYNRGSYGETGDLPERMMEYADMNGLTFIGPVFNIFLFDEMSNSDSENYLLQASASVKRTRPASFRTSAFR